MNLHLRVLIIEDLEDDMLLMLRELKRGGYTLDYIRVDTPSAMQAALDSKTWDVAIADYTLPTFSAPEALKLLQTQELDLPFIIVSGTIGEEIAVAAMKAGAHDYIIKGNLTRLLPAVERELREAKERQQRRSAEQALRASQERIQMQARELSDANNALREYALELEELYNYAPCGYHSLDKHGVFVRINDTELKMLGYERDEIIGKKTFADLLTADSLPTFHANFPLLQQQGWVRNLEFQMIRSDGKIIPVSVSATALTSQGNFLRSRFVVIDISDRKRAEEKNREQAALLDITTDAIFVQDLKYRILFWNKGAERLYERESAAVLGKNAIELLYQAGETRSQFADIEITLLQQEQWQGELQQLTFSGKTIVVASRWTLVRDEAGNPKSILTVNTDITEKKQLERQFLRVQRLESLGTLASGIAHDFNNILTPILAAVQLLPMKVSSLDEQSLGLLTLIEDSTKRGAALVKQILAFARGAEGKKVPLQVRHILSEAIQVVRQTFPKNIKISSDISSANLWTVAADANQLHQVLLNLCVNARDAMPSGGNLTLFLENQQIDAAYARMNLEACVGSYVVIKVTDTGTGMPPEVLERIFDPFFTTKEPGKGTGLGLSTVLGIVKNHGGFIKVDSEVGRGTEFSIYLAAIADAARAQDEKLALLQGQHELILVVDDEPLICQVTQTTLEAYNYQALVASDGYEAIALYVERAREIDAVLMDIMMPTIDGLTAIHTLQELNPHIKIIATSGLASNKQLAQDIGSSVKAFLSKPYTAKELLDTLQRVLSN
ncbi:hybrid sensor histidine kinase/response regulator [Aliterella atlantica]|uniref:histidine kinase n=1 Tax=Aliterella atlantica CENA595 TaxID=1618023 RepID=A0A0D8ZXY5_9CYAN|nr:response regulator [Aliterella atlantica]KJH73299.1 hypothetical protein UH38_00395 [Aliterella atlantica CENA595]